MARPELVTGATGFIGRHLLAALVREGRRVRILCREGSEAKLPPEVAMRVEVVHGDLRDRASIERAVAGCGRVFHCAGHVSDWGTEAAFVAANVTATAWLLEAAARAGVERFVHLSSIAVFGVPSPAEFDDASPYGPGDDLYSRTKIDGERLAMRWHREHGLPVTVLRPPVVYGTDGTWFEEPLRMIRARKMFLLGGGRGTCHPCYIDNLVAAMLLVGDHPAAIGQAYIVGDGESITFREYFDHLAAIADAGPIRRSVPVGVARALAIVLEAIARLGRATARPLLTRAAIDMVTTPSRMSAQKIASELGFSPRYSVATAMAALREAHQRRHRDGSYGNGS